MASPEKPAREDPYKSSRDALRETVKWVAASLAALAAAVAGGISVSILPDLTGRDYWITIAVGALIICAILLAIYYIQEMLSIKLFPINRLYDKRSPDRIALKPYEKEILPHDLESIEDFLDAYDKAKKIADIKEIRRLRSVKAKIVSFASYLSLRRRTRNATRILLVVFFLVCAGIAYLTSLHGSAKQRLAVGDSVPIEFSPGVGWADVAAALADACGSTSGAVEGSGFRAKGRADVPSKGWWRIEISAPETCAGVYLTVPAGATLELNP